EAPCMRWQHECAHGGALRVTGIDVALGQNLSSVGGFEAFDGGQHLLLEREVVRIVEARVGSDAAVDHRATRADDDATLAELAAPRSAMVFGGAARAMRREQDWLGSVRGR